MRNITFPVGNEPFTEQAKTLLDSVKNKNMNIQHIKPLILAAGLACGFNAHAGTYTCDFTRGLDTNRWGLSTSYPYACYSNSIDSRGITFQRVADPPAPTNPRQTFGSFMGLTASKITTDGRLIIGDFIMTFTYTNLNNFTAHGDGYGAWAVNQVKAWVQWGDGGDQRRIMVGRKSSSLVYWWLSDNDFFRGCVSDDDYQMPANYSITNAAPFGSSSSLKIARTNGVLSYFVNDQLLGIDGVSWRTTNDIVAVTLQFLQGNAAEHAGITFQSFSLSGPSIADAQWPAVVRPLLGITRETNGVRLEWTTASGATYQFENSSTMTNWAALGAPVTGQGGATNLVIPMNNSPAFFRLRMQ